MTKVNLVQQISMAAAIPASRPIDHLRRMGKVIYLHLEYETMCRRIQNLDSRGVVLQAGYTLQDMYKERLPLYRRYADAVIKCDNNTVEQTAQQIARCAR